MKSIIYTLPLTDEDKVEIKFTKSRGKILRFVVQYYGLINSRWRTIMRIDACHGYPHRHVYHFKKKEFKISLDVNNNVAFTESKEYVIKNFRKIKENFLFTK